MPKKDETEEPEVEETEDDPEEDDADDDGEEENWNRLRGMVGDVVEEKLGSWQPKVKTTSSRSQRKPETPKRKKGFLTDGFFSNKQK